MTAAATSSPPRGVFFPIEVQEGNQVVYATFCFDAARPGRRMLLVLTGRGDSSPTAWSFDAVDEDQAVGFLMKKAGIPSAAAHAVAAAAAAIEKVLISKARENERT